MDDIANILGDLVFKRLSESSSLDKEDPSGYSKKQTDQINDTPPATQKQDSPNFFSEEELDDVPLREDGYQVLQFPDPAVLLAFYDEHINSKRVTLHPWQVEVHQQLANAKATQQNPYKFCLVTCNGSGKDAFIITGFVVWFTLTKIRSRVILTSSSGVQLSSQTESYIRSFCEKVNKFHQAEIYRIRQRYIKCSLTGSEIRFFATDEAGKAEGYHPFEPDSEMAIVVNEGKSVSEEIHGALRRCTGYNYWLEVSTPGAPSGFFYNAAKTWTNVKTISTYDCPHLSKDEVEQDKIELGEHSALFRSKHLALFTSLEGDAIIPMEAVAACIKHWAELKEASADYDFPSWPTRIGIDLAAGAAETCVTFSQGTRVKKEVAFKEIDTEITADRIEQILIDNKISKSHAYIYADDGGVGRSIIDKLVRRGWTIQRVLNQSPATAKKLYGNKGAENWYRIKRLIEEKVIDLTGISEKTIDQLQTRRYKQVANSGRIFLESKKDAIADGRPSPDRADALILSFTGLTLTNFLEEVKEKVSPKPRPSFRDAESLLSYYEDEVTFSDFKPDKQIKSSKRIYNSLRAALN